MLQHDVSSRFIQMVTDLYDGRDTQQSLTVPQAKGEFP